MGESVQILWIKTRERTPPRQSEGGCLPLWTKQRWVWVSGWVNCFCPHQGPKTSGISSFAERPPPPCPSHAAHSPGLIWFYDDSDALFTPGLLNSLHPSMPDTLIYLTHRAPFSETQSAPQTCLQLFISPFHHPHSLPGPTPLSHLPPSKVNAKVKELWSSKWERTRECSGQRASCSFPM